MPRPTAEEVAARGPELRTLRKAARVTLDEAAAVLGINRKTYRRKEVGDPQYGTFDDEQYHKLLRYFGQRAGERVESGVPAEMRAARARAGLAHTAAGEILGLDRESYRLREEGRTAVTGPELALLARAYGRPLRELFPSYRPTPGELALAEPMPVRGVDPAHHPISATITSDARPPARLHRSTDQEAYTRELIPRFLEAISRLSDREAAAHTGLSHVLIGRLRKRPDTRVQAATVRRIEEYLRAQEAESLIGSMPPEGGTEDHAADLPSVLVAYYEGMLRRMTLSGDPEEARLRKLDALEGLRRFYSTVDAVPAWWYRVRQRVEAGEL